MKTGKINEKDIAIIRERLPELLVDKGEIEKHENVIRKYLLSPECEEMSHLIELARTKGEFLYTSPYVSIEGPQVEYAAPRHYVNIGVPYAHRIILDHAIGRPTPNPLVFKVWDDGDMVTEVNSYDIRIPDDIAKEMALLLSKATEFYAKKRAFERLSDDITYEWLIAEYPEAKALIDSLRDEESEKIGEAKAKRQKDISILRNALKEANT